jgi:hypothetical protein
MEVPGGAIAPGTQAANQPDHPKGLFEGGTVSLGAFGGDSEEKGATGLS